MNELNHTEKVILKSFVRMVRASESVQSIINDKISNDGLTGSQFGVLEALFHHGSLSHGELAEKILKSSGNITLVIDNLEKQELVCRHPDPNDRRKMLVSLCAKGDVLIRKILPDHLSRIYNVFKVLDETEIETFSNLCKKLGIHAKSLNR